MISASDAPVGMTTEERQSLNDGEVKQRLFMDVNAAFRGVEESSMAQNTALNGWYKSNPSKPGRMQKSQTSQMVYMEISSRLGKTWS